MRIGGCKGDVREQRNRDGGEQTRGDAHGALPSTFRDFH